jgi:hypothetical protein
MTRAPVAHAAHVCAVCGERAAFGFGPPMRRDQVWTCAAHKAQGAPDAGRAAFAAYKKAPKSGHAKPGAAPDLFGGR